MTRPEPSASKTVVISSPDPPKPPNSEGMREEIIPKSQESFHILKS